MRPLAFVSGAVALSIVISATANAGTDKAGVPATYAEIAAAKHPDKVTTARNLRAAVEALISDPSVATMTAARTAWLNARVDRLAAAGEFLRAVSRSDVCGHAPHPDGFLACDGFGGLVCVGSSGARPVARWNLSWDNQIFRL